MCHLLPLDSLWLGGGWSETRHPVCYTSECMGRPAPGPYKAEEGRTQPVGQACRREAGF